MLFVTYECVNLFTIFLYLGVTVVDSLKDVEANESNFAKFTCAVDTPKYNGGKWFCDGQEIAFDERKYTISSNGRMQELLIKDLTKGDSGIYTYIAGNNSRTEAKLSVNPVTILESFQNIVGIETATIEMKVVISHEGIYGAWYRNGQLLKVCTCAHKIVNVTCSSYFYAA